MHGWLPSQIDSKKCAKCSRAFNLHLAPICEACGKFHKDSEIYGRLDDPRAMLLCPSCTQKEHDAVDLILHKTKILIANPEIKDDTPFANKGILESPVNGSPFASLSSPSLVEQSKVIDESIRYNGDFFNAKTIAFADLKKSIMEDESIGDLQTRRFRYQEVIAERLEHLKNVVFKLDQEKHEAITEQLAARDSLREYGNSIREEIRERIKASDANYTPHQIIKAPKISKPKVSAMDRLIEALSTLKGISKEEAKELIMKGKS